MSSVAPLRAFALLVLACGVLVVSGAASGLPAGTSKTGMVCFDGSLSGSTRTFDLTANTGAIQTPDGNSVFMWSYSTYGPAAGYPTFQYPGPVLCANQGETIQVHLRNSLPEPTSIVFPGQDAQVSASGGTAGLLTTEATSGGDVTYSFTASEPGTYLYESGSEIAKQVEMGLYGALIIRPAGHPDHAYAEPGGYGTVSTQFDPSHEYLLLLAEIDPDLHHAVEMGGTYDATKLHNRYYTVNGRSFPDTLQDNGTGLLPSQPYGSLVRIQPNSPTNDQPALIRMLDAGVDNHPFHPHGNHLTQIAQDGRLLVHPDGKSAATERFGETIGSGDTEDYLLRWDSQGTDTGSVPFNDAWDPTTNPFPISPPNYRDVTFKDSRTWYSGSPYLGYKGTLPAGTTTQNVCGEWYFPWHSHALNEFTNFDEGFGGMATLLRVDPTSGCFAFPTSTKIETGTLNGGTYADLAADDTHYYKVNSTTSGSSRTTSWYGQFSNIPAGSSNLRVTYKGNDVLSPSTGTTYTQDFNSLASTGSATTLPPGWHLFETGSGTPDSSYTADDGSSTAGDTYSYGPSSGSSTTRAERALGSLRTSSVASTFGAAFTNTTGGTITSLAISYTGERWRKGQNGGSTNNDRLDFQYSVDATSLTTGTWIDANALDFPSPGGGGSAGPRTQSSSRSGTISALAIPNGATYWVRWVDYDVTTGTGADDGLAVDNFNLTPSYTGGSVQTTLYVYNWNASSWQQFAGSTAVGAADVTVADLAAVPAYIGTGKNNGLVRVRVQTTGDSTSFVTGGNLMKLAYDAP
ncbi:MAG TPA: multicopper oxidase domain-containing protein [Gaiellaceae bacterium]|nr:multicopper oxidase domain-containing protein [Gaiellaceae bacterium]